MMIRFQYRLPLLITRYVGHSLEITSATAAKAFRQQDPSAADMFCITGGANIRLFLLSFLLIGFPASVHGVEVQSAPAIEVRQQEDRNSLILRWPVQVLTEYRRDGRNLVFTFDQPLKNEKVATIPRLLPGAVERVDYGYDSLLLGLTEGVNTRVVELADGVRIDFVVKLAKGREKDLRSEHLRALALYNIGQVMEARSILSEVLNHQPDNADAVDLLVQIENQLERGSAALSVFNDFVATGGTLAPWMRQQQQYLMRSYGKRIRAVGESTYVENEETQWITRLEGGYNMPRQKLSLALLAENRWVDVETLQRSDGTISSFTGTRQQGLLKLRKDWVSAQATILHLSAASNGVGGGIRHDVGSNFGVSSFSASLNEPFYEFAESIVDSGSQDRLAIHHKARLLGNRLMGNVGVSLERYGISDESDVAKAVEAMANIQTPLFQRKPYIALEYSLFGRYVTEKKEKVDENGEPFEPLPLQTVEVHSIGLSISQTFFRTFTYNLSGGYSIDRKAGSGAFGTTSLGYDATERLQFGLSASAYPRLDRASDATQFTAKAYLVATF